MEHSEIIKTTYTDKTGQEKIQYWLAGIDESTFYIQKLLNNTGGFSGTEIKKYFDQLSCTWKWQEITFIPLTENTELAYESRAFHRGYETDMDPFIVRGKSIGEISIVISDEKHFYIKPYNRMAPKLTPGQIDWINNTFMNQLNKYYNQSFIEYLQSNAKERAKRRIRTIVESLKKEADVFIGYIEKLS